MTDTQLLSDQPIRVVGRYALYGKLATGGMATVHFGRLLGPVGFSRTVAIKRLHPQFAKDPEFVAMFLDEARLAARIQHPNVAATLDVVAMGEELFLVMDYLRGETFSRVLRTARKRGITLPEGFIGSVMAGTLHGLHAAHEATDERGQPLKVVHRDVSPQNFLVGTDGVSRILDFGVAKAAARIQITRDGQMKGKLSYMSPEQLSGRPIDRRSDIFAAGVVLWEALAGQRLFVGEHASDVLTKILKDPIPSLRSVNPNVRVEVAELVARALEKEPDARFQTAREFAIALEECMELLSSREVGEWVEEIAGESLLKREQTLAEIESVSSVSELSALTPSEPSFMRTMVGNTRIPIIAPRISTSPAPQQRLVDDEPATTIYHSSQPLALPDDNTAVFDMNLAGDMTDPSVGRELVPSNPFKPDSVFTSSRLMAGGALLVVLFAVFQWATDDEPSKLATTDNSQAEVPEPPPKPQSKKTESPPETTVVARPEPPLEPSNLPKARRPSAPRRRVVPPPQLQVAPPITKTKCTPPWRVDSQGIRRLKPGCLGG